VTVINPDNQKCTLPNAITLRPGPAPIIYSFSPANGPHYGGTSVTLTGQNLMRVSSVKIDGEYADCTKITDSTDPTKLTLVTPAGCNGKITVDTQDGTSGVSSTNFHYNDPSRPLTFMTTQPVMNPSYPIACKDQDITIFYNGSPACDAIDKDSSLVSITALNTELPTRFSASISGVSTSSSNRTMKVHLTKVSCPGADVIYETQVLTITAKTATGVTKTTTLYVYVESPPQESLAVSISPSISGLSVNFTSNVTGGSPSYTYQWNFGDGGTSTLSNPSHTYSTAGTYTVTLTVKDSSSPQLSATATSSVTVSSSTSLTVSATASPTSSYIAPVTVNFTCLQVEVILHIHTIGHLEMGEHQRFKTQVIPIKVGGCIQQL